MIKTLDLPRRKLFLISAIAVVFLIVLTAIFAPSRQSLQQGFTYSRDPSGYGAWAAFMETRGTPIQRWQKPLNKLSKKSEKITLLQIQNSLQTENFSQNQLARQWIEKGNRLIILGVLKPVTEAPYRTHLVSFYNRLVGI